MSTLGKAAHDSSDCKEFSILVTCFCEENVIDEFHARLSAAMSKASQTYELIYVDDGSSDGTFEKLSSIFQEDPNVACVLRLLCNVGQTNAQTAAIAHASGTHFIFIDADLQVDPEDVLLLIDAFNGGCDLVSGCRIRRCDPLWRRIASSIANRLLRRVSRRQLKDIGCGFKVLNGQLIRAFQFSQYKPFRPVSVVRAAGSWLDVPIKHHPRRYNKSGWTVSQLFAFYRNIFVETAENFFHVISLTCLASLLVFFVGFSILWSLGWKASSESFPGFFLAISMGNILVTTTLLGLLGEFTMRNTRMFQEDPVYIIREKLSR